MSFVRANIFPFFSVQCSHFCFFPSHNHPLAFSLGSITFPAVPPCYIFLTMDVTFSFLLITLFVSPRLVDNLFQKFYFFSICFTSCFISFTIVLLLQLSFVDVTLYRVFFFCHKHCSYCYKETCFYFFFNIIFLIYYGT